MGSFRYDSTGIDPNAKKYPLIPDGWFPFRIVEAEAGTSKSGYPMVTVKCKCLDLLQSEKGPIAHWVVFLPKGKPGDGMNVHFRKSIKVPWEGDVEVDTNDWLGKTFMGKVVTEEYNGNMNNKFKSISPMRDGEPVAKESEEENPFDN